MAKNNFKAFVSRCSDILDGAEYSDLDKQIAELAIYARAGHWDSMLKTLRAKVEAHQEELAQRDAQIEKMAQQITTMGNALKESQEKMALLTESRDQWEANAHEFSRCADRFEAQLAELASQEPVRYMNRFTGICFTRGQQPDAASDPAVYMQLFARAAPPAPVKLPPAKSCPAEYEGSLLWTEVQQWNKAIAACAESIKAAGVEVEGE